MIPILKTLVIVNHVVHYRSGGLLYAYGPYVREIDIWADLFPQVRIVAPCRIGIPPGDALAFTHQNIDIVPVPETGGSTLWAKLHQIMLLPAIIWLLVGALHSADAIHVRCPGNLGLLGALIVPLFSKHRIAKYAGQWGSYPGEAWTVRMQRAILRSRWWGAPVTVYGKWPGQPPHVVPFFTSILSEEQMSLAHNAATDKQPTVPAKILFVGRLSRSKQADTLIRAVARAIQDGVAVQLTIIGDGPERVTLEHLSLELGIADQVVFTGALPFERVLDYYQSAHLLVLVSETEGWPKAIAEAMAFGLVCIGCNRGAVPWLLSEGRGRTISVGDVDGLAALIEQIVQDPAAYQAISRAAAPWAQQFTLEGLREALRLLMLEWWQLDLQELQA